MDKKKLYVLVGPQASGKSTWHRNFANELPLLPSDSWFLTEDDGRRFWIESGKGKCYYNDGLNPSILAEAWSWVWQRFAEYLRHDASFVLEGTYPTRVSRSHVINIAKSFGYEVVCISFTLPLEECLQRNRNRVNVVPDKVIARTYASMEEPDWNEGWHQIIDIQ